MNDVYRGCGEPAEFYNVQDERNLVCVGHYLMKSEYEKHWWMPLPHADAEENG